MVIEEADPGGTRTNLDSKVLYIETDSNAASRLVFELTNLKNHPKFEEIDDRVPEISKDEFVDLRLELELEALNNAAETFPELGHAEMQKRLEITKVLTKETDISVITRNARPDLVEAYETNYDNLVWDDRVDKALDVVWSILEQAAAGFEHFPPF